MNCAIYPRKSTEQHGVAVEAKSVTRQTDNARAFAAARGWTVVAEFADDGISGTEFRKRPGLQQLKRALKPRAPFGVLIVEEQKALGRESSETQFLIKQLAQAGVEVFSYLDNRSLTPRNYLDKAMSAMRSMADEAHAEDTAKRTHAAHRRLAEKGRVCGGRVFGYRNADVVIGTDAHGRPLRSHVERAIVEEEAAVVRRIFELYAGGVGLKGIAKRLTLDGAVEPKPVTRKDGLTPPQGWASSTVRSILKRELYRGVVVWNRSRKRDNYREIKQQPRPAEDEIRAVRPELRIVPEDLWVRVASRRADTEGRAIRFEGGRISGRPPKHAVQNLLAGLATCGVCGGGLVVETSARKRGRVSEYVCHRHRYGRCPNALRIALADMNEAVLQAIEEHALTPEAVEQVVALTERDDLRERQDALRAERADTEKRIARLIDVLATGAGDVGSLVAKLRELEQRKTAITRELEQLMPVPRLAPAVIENRLAEWRRLLRQSVTQGRAVLQRVLQGRITFTPAGTGYEFSAPTRFDKLFAGVAGPRPSFIKEGDRTGIEDITPADTPDVDYGVLLERACGNAHKGGTSPTGTASRWSLPVKGFSDLKGAA